MTTRRERAHIAAALIAYRVYRAWHRALVWGERRGWVA